VKGSRTLATPVNKTKLDYFRRTSGVVLYRLLGIFLPVFIPTSIHAGVRGRALKCSMHRFPAVKRSAAPNSEEKDHVKSLGVTRQQPDDPHCEAGSKTEVPKSGCSPIAFINCGANSSDYARGRILGIWEEATGVLHHVITSEGSLVAEIGPVNVLLPPELEDELEPLVGERIGLLKTDLARPYRVRLVR